MNTAKAIRTIDIDSEESEGEEDAPCSVCQTNAESKGFMVECEKCQHWLHGGCVGFKGEDEVPEPWFCHLCEEKLQKARPQFEFIEENQWFVDRLIKDYISLERASGNQFPHSIDFRESLEGRLLLERYSLLFARRQFPTTQEVFFKAVATLFGRTEQEMKEVFYSIADEVEKISEEIQVDPAQVDSAPRDPYDGWKPEVTNVYPKAGAKRPPSCDDARCACIPFRKAEYPQFLVKECPQLPRAPFGLFANEEILNGTLIIEFVGKVLKADQVKKTARESAELLFDHDIPFTFFHKKEDGTEACIDARQRGNIARFIHHSCQPTAQLQVHTAHGRTYMGVYAKGDLAVGAPITVPFRFLGETFRSTARCFCGSSDTCSMAKWYAQRAAQAANLRVIERPTHKLDWSTSARSPAEEKKKPKKKPMGARMGSGSSKDARRAASESAKGKRKKRREEELAAVTRGLWADSDGFTPRRKRRAAAPTPRLEEPKPSPTKEEPMETAPALVQAAQEEAAVPLHPKTPPPRARSPVRVKEEAPPPRESSMQRKRKLDASNPVAPAPSPKKQKIKRESAGLLREPDAFRQLVREISELQRAIIAPLPRVPTLRRGGKKQSILRAYDEICRRRPTPRKSSPSEFVHPKKRKALRETRSVPLVEELSIVEPAPVKVPEPAPPTVVVKPAVIEAPPSPPRLVAPVPIRGLSQSVPVGRYRPAEELSRPDGRFGGEPSLPGPPTELYPPVGAPQSTYPAPQSPSRGNRSAILGLPRSRNRWDDSGADPAEAAKSRAPPRRFEPVGYERGLPRGGFSSSRDEGYRREDEKGLEMGDGPRSPVGLPDHRRYETNRAPPVTHPMTNAYPPYTLGDRGVNDYPPVTQQYPANNSSRQWGPPRGSADYRDRRRDTNFRGRR